MQKKLFYTEDDLKLHGQLNFWTGFTITCIGWLIALIGTLWLNGGTTCFSL